MYRIRRIYLDGVGHSDAFYRDMLFDFANKHGEANSEVLLNAGNGVGKTSALALIFNTLVPTRKLFIQTMQKPHQKLEDSVHGTPGLILSPVFPNPFCGGSPRQPFSTASATTRVTCLATSRAWCLVSILLCSPISSCTSSCFCLSRHPMR